jgi:hypothetical protein
MIGSVRISAYASMHDAGGARPGCAFIHVFLKNSVDLIGETGYNENMLWDLWAKRSI